VEVRCNVTGARVLVHDKLVGLTPLPTTLQVNAGKPVIEVVAEGYAPFHKEVELPAGVTTPIEVTLEPKKKATGALAIRVSGDPATVEIDGSIVRTTPVEVELDPGTHAIVLRRPGFVDLDASMTVVAGEHRELSLDLAPKAHPLVARWWFWTAIGAVVAAGAVTAIVLAANTEHHGTGDGFTPGTQSAPLVRW
jgi:hypothetical protein